MKTNVLIRAGVGAAAIVFTFLLLRSKAFQRLRNRFSRIDRQSEDSDQKEKSNVLSQLIAQNENNNLTKTGR